MGMRVDCRHYETRTYSSDEVVHMCRLDMAPDAPWRCPDGCPMFERRMFDAGWTVGTLGRRNQPEEPTHLPDEAAALLDQAEDIVNSVGPDILADVDKQRKKAKPAQARGSRWKRRRRK